MILRYAIRRIHTTPLAVVLLISVPAAALAQFIPAPQPTLAGTRELGAFATIRALSNEYSAYEGGPGFGAAITLASHVTGNLALEIAVPGAYSGQAGGLNGPSLVTFTPTLSAIVQRSTVNELQPYVVLGGGYELVRYLDRCDCGHGRGIGNAGLGVRRMTSNRQAVRIEASAQLGRGAPAFTVLGGVSWFLGERRHFVNTRVPRDRRNEPPLIPIPKQTTTIQRASEPDPAPAPPAIAVGSETAGRVVPALPIPTREGALILQLDGTQLNFSKPTWLSDAQELLDGLVAALSSDAGKRVGITIEAHTDNLGSNAANIMVGLDRAGVVRDYLVSHGVARERIKISSAGEDSPVAPNTTAAGRQRNRRILISRDN